MTDLYTRSIEIIRENQSPSGAYPASPNFPTYRYCWFRDGAFIAYAMDLAGENASAARFHAWAAATLNAREEMVRAGLEKARSGVGLEPGELLHTRYTLAGEISPDDWPNFQLDGFGTWLWALEQHARHNPEVKGRREAGLPALKEDLLRAARLAGDYLSALWSRQCFDCWEEFPEYLHTYTLAAVLAGLRAEMGLTGSNRRRELAGIKRLLFEVAVQEDHFVKHAGSNQVDASLLGLATPYRVVAPQDICMVATVARIETELWHGGGVKRYRTDTYYGGGEWVLLAAWLGWYFAECGELDKARRLHAWVEAQADEHGFLPEQSPVRLNDPASYRPWVERWGPIARPLLWSHANYMILHQALGSYAVPSAEKRETVCTQKMSDSQR